MSLLLVLSMKSVRASFGVLVWWADARVRSGWAASSPLNGRVYDQSLHYALWPAAARPLCSVTSYGMPRDDQRGLNEACPASYFEPGFCWQVTLFYEVVVVVCVGRKSRIENLSSNNGCKSMVGEGWINGCITRESLWKRHILSHSGRSQQVCFQTQKLVLELQNNKFAARYHLRSPSKTKSFEQKVWFG